MSLYEERVTSSDILSPANSANLTPETLIRNMGGVSSFHKHYTSARMKDRDDALIVIKWLEANNYEVCGFEEETIAYRRKLYSSAR